ncbi:MAG TPA: hypothetical protein VG674_14780 [Amycolatopsis sp.]|jgi:hypothetical protein|nr:hypothetical protein [Amycolatopsis sp.]
MDEDRIEETYNPWTVVDVVFRHLVDCGLHPTLGAAGPPGEPAAQLLRALGITPTAEGDVRVHHETQSRLAQLRKAMMEDG